MTAILNRLDHPGPRAADRRQVVPATLRRISGRLQAGRAVMEEVAALFARSGGQTLSVDGGWGAGDCYEAIPPDSG